MLLNFILLIAGFVVLIFGADWLVKGASGLAKRLNVPDLVIGLTVVAFGTSMPEFVVNLMAAIEGSSEIALTNILGSNIINVLVILGMSAAISPIPSTKSTIQFEIPLSILAGLAVLVLGTDCFGLLDSKPDISQIDGLILLLIFSFFMWHTMRMAHSERKPNETSYTPMKIWKAIVFMILGIAGLVLGGELIVRNAVSIAKAWHISEAVIGVTIVALGTSLPELATSALAAYKKNTDLALGNVIGSNIFNVFFVLGTSALIRPLPAYSGMIIDALIATTACVLVLVFVRTNKRHEVKRWQGGFLLLCYAIYLVWLVTNI